MKARQSILNLKHLLAIALILGAGIYIAMVARDGLRAHVYAVCLGSEGTGYRVTRDEMASCACKTEAALAAVPVKSRLPRWLAPLSSQDWGNMLIAQAACVKARN